MTVEVPTGPLHLSRGKRMGLLDPRFDYVPAASTDVAATWKRFGFNPRANEERRARLKVTAVTPRRVPEILKKSSQPRLSARS